MKSAVVRTTEGFWRLVECPTCGCLVFWTDMYYYADGQPATCRFCEEDRENRRIIRQEGREARALRAMELTKPCSLCGKPIPSHGYFGPPTYTDVPENHAEDCPVRKIMELRQSQEMRLSPWRKHNG